MKVTIRGDVGFCGTDQDFETLEVPDGLTMEEIEAIPEVKGAMQDAHESMMSYVSVWVEVADD